jgi:hypothetical protein
VITISEANYQNNDPITEDKYIISLISVKKISEEKSNTNVVCLGWPIAPSYMSPYGRGGGGCVVSANEYSCAHGAQINVEGLTPYLTYGHSQERNLFAEMF